MRIFSASFIRTVENSMFFLVSFLSVDINESIVIDLRALLDYRHLFHNSNFSLNERGASLHYLLSLLLNISLSNAKNYKLNNLFVSSNSLKSINTLTGRKEEFVRIGETALERDPPES